MPYPLRKSPLFTSVPALVGHGMYKLAVDPGLLHKTTLQGGLKRPTDVEGVATPHSNSLRLPIFKTGRSGAFPEPSEPVATG